MTQQFSVSATQNFYSFKGWLPDLNFKRCIRACNLSEFEMPMLKFLWIFLQNIPI